MENVPKWSLKDVRIDLYANDISYRRMIDNLKKISPNGMKIIELITKKNKVNYHNEKTNPNKLNLYDKKLNKSQVDSIKNAMESKDFYLIHGPFGTGKTRTLVELIKQEMKLNKKVLICTESNTAVDNILNRLIKEDNIEKNHVVRLGHPQRVSKKNKKFTLSYKVESHQNAIKISKLLDEAEELKLEQSKFIKPSPKYRRGFSDEDIKILAKNLNKKNTRGIPKKIIRSMAKWISINEEVDFIYKSMYKIEQEIIENIISESKVIVSTNSSAALEYIENVKFDICIIDEASQSTIPSVLIPIAKSDKFILAGDHKQLPPTVLNKDAIELSYTLFEFLISKYPNKYSLLDIQYRMNTNLMEIPNKLFYKNKIKAFKDNYDFKNEIILKENYPTKESIENHLRNKDILFLDTSGLRYKNEKRFKKSFSKYNPVEAQFISKISIDLLLNNYKGEDIGIISPYNDQINCIKKFMKKEFLNNKYESIKLNNKESEYTEKNTDLLEINHQEKDIYLDEKDIEQIEEIEVKSVDGFQGREKEIILISLVRSNNSRDIGFLSDLRRLNVSLTRVKRKLIIIGDSKTLKNHYIYDEWINQMKKKNYYMKINKQLNIESIYSEKVINESDI